MDKQKSFDDGENISGCLKNSMAGLLEVYGHQLQNDMSSVRSVELMEAMQVYLSRMKCKNNKAVA